ncbi:MAG TPA: imelysin family protein, partial [Ideonella sp.]|nr:imelysin family protein [Ideonella sp.]
MSLGLPWGRRPLLALAAALAGGIAAASAGAQAPARPAGVPAYSPAAFVQGQWQHWYLPQAAAFVQAGTALQQAMQQHCGGAPKQAAQQRWRDTLLAWDKLSAVAVGPLVQRRSARRIDFAPTRPELIQKAIAGFNAEAKDNDAALERVGSAARGFAALEWLLWTQPGAKLDAASCRFAAALATDLLGEATALAGDFQAQAKGFEGDAPDAAKVTEAMSEALNQWTGG